MQSRRRAPSSDDGAAAVEFALVSTLLLTIVFGILQYGYFFVQLQNANHAAREGARLAAVGVDDCAAFVATVKERAGAADPTTITLTFDSATPVAGSTATVAVTWAPLSFGFPFVPFLGSDPRDESAESRVESVGSVDETCTQ